MLRVILLATLLITPMTAPATAQLFDCLGLTQRCALAPCVEQPCTLCQEVQEACIKYNRMLSTMLVLTAPLTCPGHIAKACYRTYQRCYLAQNCDTGDTYDQACLRECGGLLKSCYKAGCGSK